MSKLDIQHILLLQVFLTVNTTMLGAILIILKITWPQQLAEFGPELPRLHPFWGRLDRLHLTRAKTTVYYVTPQPLENWTSAF